MKIFRGGAWISLQEFVSSDYRDDYNSNNQHYLLGFRVMKRVEGKERALRSGAWNLGQGIARLAFRFWGDPFDRAVSVGFRVMRRTPCEG